MSDPQSGSNNASETGVEEEIIPFNEDDFRNELTALIPHLRAFSRSLCGNATLADDVAQDALLKAWNARERFRPGSNLKAWTFTILRNQFYSIKRRSSWMREILKIRLTGLEPYKLWTLFLMKLINSPIDNLTG